ncbi:MAG: trigger factor [Gallionella sp.]|nr:trigger factor [Gallionella sp.]
MSSVETVSALERRLNASIPQQAIIGEVAARLKHIGRTAKIAGFRPGKIPNKVLEQYYGVQAHQEALGEALQRSFAEAAQVNNLKVAGYPEFDVKTADLKAETIEYSATFEVYPEIEVGSLAGESLERTTYALSDTDVDNTVETLRKQRSVFVAVDRAAQSEDQVNVDFTGKLNGEIFQGGEAKDYPVQIGVGRMLPEFEAAIIGMKVGETKSFDMTFPETYHGKDVAGKEVTFTITLNKVEAPKLPELDAEFAMSVGIPDGDVSRLTAEIRVNLQRELDRRLKVRNKDVAMDALLKVTQFDVPKSLVDWEAKSLMQQALRDMEQRGMKAGAMQLPLDLFKVQATKRVKLGLILAEVVKKHDLQAKPGQIKALIQDYAQSFDEPEQVIRWYAAEPKRMQEVENLALEENVVAWVMSQAKVTDKVAVFSELMGNA